MGRKAKFVSGLTRFIPKIKKTKPIFTGHTCPWCKMKAAAMFNIPEGSHLDPRLGKIGICPNKDCLNSDAYYEAHLDPPYSKHELKTKKIERIAGMVFETMKIDMELESARLIVLHLKRGRKLDAEHNWLACPVCNEWKIEVLDDSAPGSFHAVCKKCKFVAHIDRT